MQRAKARIRIAHAAALLLLGLLLSPFSWAGQLAGKVTFVSGEASVLRDDQELPLSTSDAVHEGDRLETRAASHVHLRMIDGAILSLRSDSALSIESYRYAPAAPRESRANLTLHRGVVRSISGEIGARSRERFRLDTPVAAIGIRGTDFSILSTDAVSRLSLSEGGVVMAPLSDQCRQGGLGPCEVAGAEELFDDQQQLLLEARLGDAAARLTREGITPDELRPPHSQETRLAPAPSRATLPRDVQRLTGDSLPGASNYEAALEQAERYMARTGLIAEAVERGDAASELQPRDRGLIDNSTIDWGRWSEFEDDNTRAVARLLHGDGRQRRYPYPVVNSVFGMVDQTTGTRRLPETGKAYFDLDRYEAYIKRGDQLEAAGISHPGLVVDFEAQRFAARLDVHAESLPGSIPVVGGGNLSEEGYLRSDGQSPSELSGFLGDAAAEAGLLFEYQVEPGVDAVGATHWALERD
ncbi:MAG: FecR family protein [Pseudomonadota bacterium]